MGSREGFSLEGSGRREKGIVRIMSALHKWNNLVSTDIVKDEERSKRHTYLSRVGAIATFMMRRCWLRTRC